MKRSQANAFVPQPMQRSKPLSPDVLKIQHDPINEGVVIAAVAVDAEFRAKIVASLDADFFFGDGNRDVWNGFKELQRRHLEFDISTFRQIAGIEAATIVEKILAVRQELPPNVVHHIEMLVWDKTRIDVARGPLSAFLDGIRDPRFDPERLRSLAKQLSDALSFGSPRKYLRDPDGLVRDQMSSVDARMGGVTCWPVGLDGIDKYAVGDPAIEKTGSEWRLTPGLAPGQVSMVTGLSGSGKTTITSLIMLAQANLGRRVLYGAWEQGSGPTLELMAGQSLGFSRTKLVTGKISMAERNALEAEMRRISKWVRFLEVPFGRVLGERRSNEKSMDTIHGYIVDTGCDVFVADLWRRALSEMAPDEEEQALYRQQAMAQETKCHVILCHQQRLKDVEQRVDKRPTRESIKGSAALVEVPDTILGIHKPALWKNIPDDKMEIIVLKQRHGPWPLAIEFDWDPVRGVVWGGKSIDYKHPGEESEFDSFINSNNKSFGKGGKRR